MKSRVVFISNDLQKNYDELEEDDFRKKAIKRAIPRIENDVFCGTQIPKRQIPREYVIKFKVTNLWKYNLPKGWRLMYTITADNEVEILSAILEWLSHPEYERKFKY